MTTTPAQFSGPPAPGPVGGRLREFSHKSTHITSDTWVLHTVSSGYQLEFTTLPPPQEFPHLSTPVPIDSSCRRSLEKEILSLVSVHPSSTPGFSSTVFLAPKATGDWRPILKLRPLNAFIRPNHFRMEDTSCRSTHFNKDGGPLP